MLSNKLYLANFDISTALQYVKFLNLNFDVLTYVQWQYFNEKTRGDELPYFSDSHDINYKGVKLKNGGVNHPPPLPQKKKITM